MALDGTHADGALDTIATTWAWLGHDAARTILDRLESEGFTVTRSSD